MKADTVEEFWSQTEQGDECWHYADTSTGAYGSVSGLIVKLFHESSAHRLAWAIVNGPIPPGMCVLHTCDNPSCCRPDHLFLGTRQDNSRDMVAKGRQCRSENVALRIVTCKDGTKHVWEHGKLTRIIPVGPT